MITEEQILRAHLKIQGAVQGVGFRPFVFRLATELQLKGWVRNSPQGVCIEVEGERARIEEFLQRLEREKPPRSVIHSLDVSFLDARGYSSFEILHSEGGGDRTALVLPDVATCADCLVEIFDPENRRFRYPFTNCTNCGPRFTIIRSLPYDRPNTTMRHFSMCPLCRAEYEDPLDRRFHAQPNACPTCGPNVMLYGPSLQIQSTRSTRSSQSTQPLEGRAGQVLLAKGDDALRRAAEALRAGKIVAVKGLGGFHLMVDARNNAAISRLRERKPRRDKPFAIMVRDLDQARALCEVPLEAERLLTSPEAPIVLLRRRPDAPVAENVAPGNPNLGIMLPYTPLHHLLLREVDFPVVATSGNLTDEPICTNELEAFQRLGHVADLFLVHDRPIERHVDDSVAWIVLDEPRLLRRARGYAPLPVIVSREIPTILAVGAHLKNTIALSIGRRVFISQHIGDLETPEALQAFERVIADFLRLYEATPVAIAYDMHPDYPSTRWAQRVQRSGGAEERRSLEDITPAPLLPCSHALLVPVQHHHAHLASCLAENGVDGPALGVTWDGTGYGTDGTIWGGEFLLGDARWVTRVAHLRPFRLPGGEAAIREPRRVGLALLWELYGEEVLAMEDLAPVRAIPPTERRVLVQMLRRGVNCPVTTSAGRLFDGIASLLDLHQRVTFEGQAAMALEFAAEPCGDGAYPLPLRERVQGERGRIAILDWQPLVEAILEDLRRGVPLGIISARFHNALVEAILSVAMLVGERRVALTGGCFQNRLLLERAARRLREEGFEVVLHRQVPPNDGGISLGQIMVAAARLEGSGDALSHG
ncbi:MAG: carbamoyltransferase HypF [Armatimonadota bacterium]|nr:carbamoyltransferase HypF [Armatimonadota bacterium]MDR7434884.1 carbamoyltransferase HypF [Armatimonadota bacterium]